MAKFRYNGDSPNGAALRLADGSIQDVMFYPGQVVDVPVDHPFIVSLEAQGYLTFLGFDYPDTPPEPPRPLTDFEQRSLAAKHPTGTLARYRYDGQQLNGAALRLLDGSILDVMFWPGQEVILPIDHKHVLSLEAQGYLTFLGKEEVSPVAPITATPSVPLETAPADTVALDTDEGMVEEKPASTPSIIVGAKRGKSTRNRITTDAPSDTKHHEVTQ